MSSAIPFVGIVTATVASFVLLAITAKTCDAVNALADAAQERQNEVAKQTPTPQFFMAKA